MISVADRIERLARRAKEPRIWGNLELCISDELEALKEDIIKAVVAGLREAIVTDLDGKPFDVWDQVVRNWINTPDIQPPAHESRPW